LTGLLNKLATRTYKNPSTTNIKVDDNVRIRYSHNPSFNRLVPKYNGTESHFIHTRPELLIQH